MVPTSFIICLFIYIAHGRKHILGANEHERITKCAEEVCDYLCLATKCGNEKIFIDEDKYESDWIRIINVHCTEQFSCMGHVTIDGEYTKKWSHYMAPPPGIEMAKIYCNNGAKHSCQGAQFIFIDTKHQYLIGDVRESDILFKNSVSSNIVIEDNDNRDTEKFFLNEVWTQNVREMNIIALAPYSLVASVFDLTGVYQKIVIQCKGEGSCSGSLFIFNRCMIPPYYQTVILCGINACNGISIWILNEDDKCAEMNSRSRVSFSRNHMVRLIPFVSGNELSSEETTEFAKRWTEQKQKDVFVMVEKRNAVSAVETQQWSILEKQPTTHKYHVNHHFAFWRPLCHSVPHQEACRYRGDAFTLHQTENMNEWIKHLTRYLKDLQSNLKDQTIDNAWIRAPSLIEYYGGIMMQSMITKLTTAAVMGIHNGIHSILLAGHAVFGAITGAISTTFVGPLIIPGIAKVGAAFFANSLRKQNVDRLEFPASKIHFIIDDQQVLKGKNAAHEAVYNELMDDEMYDHEYHDTNWVELDANGNMVQYDLFTGEKYYEDVEPMFDDGHFEYTSILMWWCAFALICAFCFGGLFGFVFRGFVFRYVINVNDDKNENE